MWEIFEAERPHLVAYAGPFDGFHSNPASVSRTCLVRFDNNKYSVQARPVGRPVEVHAGACPRAGQRPDPGAERILIRQDGDLVADHPRQFGRGGTVYDPWHYVPVLSRKPGALRNGAPFKDWALPGSTGRIRARILGQISMLIDTLAGLCACQGISVLIDVGDDEANPRSCDNPG